MHHVFAQGVDERMINVHYCYYYYYYYYYYYVLGFVPAGSVVSQASQHLRVAFLQSIWSVISFHSGMPRAEHAAATICVHNVLRRCTSRLYLHMLIAPLWCIC